MSAKECENYQKNLKYCNCTYDPCDKKGYCCECMRYHFRMGQLPACFFSAEVERTYDRSIARFVREQQKAAR